MTPEIAIAFIVGALFASMACADSTHTACAPDPSTWDQSDGQKCLRVMLDSEEFADFFHDATCRRLDAGTIVGTAELMALYREFIPVWCLDKRSLYDVLHGAVREQEAWFRANGMLGEDEGS